MEPIAETRLVQIDPPSFKEAWEMVAGQLRMEMSRANYESWVHPLQPLGYKEGVYRVGAINSYGRDWVESRLRSRITRLLESVYNQPLTVQFALSNGASTRAEARHSEPTPEPPAEQLAEREEAKQGHPTQVELPALATADSTLVGRLPVVDLPKTTNAGKERTRGGLREQEEKRAENGRSRKIQLQRAYGTERARVIQPERGMFLTMYFFNNWLPLIGHSAMTVIIAARSLCYWNPMTGELRNTVETDMAELARRASVSVRTVKDVLNTELVCKYFLRYKVRRMMTPNGVRTAGILLQVRMDDPLTPEDQDQNQLTEEEHWYTLDIEDEDD